MKVLQNKTLEVTDTDGTKISYKTLARMVMRQSAAKGVTCEEMRKRLKIHEELDKDGEDLRFEDDYAKMLQDLVKQMRWPEDRTEFLQFCDDVAAMKGEGPAS